MFFIAPKRVVIVDTVTEAAHVVGAGFFQTPLWQYGAKSFFEFLFELVKRGNLFYISNGSSPMSCDHLDLSSVFERVNAGSVTRTTRPTEFINREETRLGATIRGTALTRTRPIGYESTSQNDSRKD